MRSSTSDKSERSSSAADSAAKGLGLTINPVQSREEWLNTLKTATSLDFSGKGIREAAVIKSLTDDLKENTSVTSLNLSNNPIRPNSARDLSELLAANKTIKVINLSATGITSKFIGSLMWGLTESAVEIIDLSHNHIEDRGCEYLAKILKTNKTLQEINLSDNSITDDGAVLLSDLLGERNKTVKIIDLRDNNLGTDAFENLNFALRLDRTVKKILLSAPEKKPAAAMDGRLKFTESAEAQSALVVRESRSAITLEEAVKTIANSASSSGVVALNGISIKFPREAALETSRNQHKKASKEKDARIASLEAEIKKLKEKGAIPEDTTTPATTPRQSSSSKFQKPKSQSTDKGCVIS